MKHALIALQMRVNGTDQEFSISPNVRLSDVLRRHGYYGVKTGCYTGDCGSCTVLLNGEPIVSCLMLAAQAQGADILTVEGLSTGARLHRLQEAFLEEGAVQCGFCIPGMLLSAHALLEQNPQPSEAQVREALTANLCRCTGYERPVRAVLRAANRLREDQ